MTDSKAVPESGKYVLSMSSDVLNHLGLNLYSSAPAVLAETIANSWDADATMVEVIIDKDAIYISDDGFGMDADDINNKYLLVGYSKRDTFARTPKFNRRVMGRKGIGKLSLFSIADTITVLTNKSGVKNALKIDANKLRERIHLNQKYYPEELSPTLVTFEKSGTTIALSRLKKGRVGSLYSGLKRHISRRFNVIGEKFNFRIFVNGDEVTISDRDYLNNAQCLMCFPDTDDKEGSAIFVESLVSQGNKEVLKKIVTCDGSLEIDGKKERVSGWLATSKEPGRGNATGNMNQITVMLRGKMAKEDIFGDLTKNTSSMYSKYVYGEINADFLDVDDSDDLTTSSRQDFFKDDRKYIALRDFIGNHLGELRKIWEATQTEEGEKAACKYLPIKEWYKDLRSDDRQAAKKLFGKINQLTITDDSKKELFHHGVIAFESMKLKNELSALDNLDSSDVPLFLNVAGKLDYIEASMYYQIVVGRLEVIQKVKEVIGKNDLEKVVQDLLSKNLWLLDPSWDRGTELPTVEETVKKQLAIVNATLSEEEQKSRFDIRYKKTSGKHIVIELKRAERNVTYQELLEQISKYHSAMEKCLAQLHDEEPFEFVILVGKHPSSSMAPGTTRHLVNAIHELNGRVMTYGELLSNAERMYSDFLVKNKDSSAMSKFIGSQEDEKNGSDDAGVNVVVLAKTEIA